MSGFDRSEFDAALDDIETYLGYLRGNDLMWEAFHQHQLSTIDQVPWPVEFNYVSPCPDKRFAVDFKYYTLIDVIVAEGEAADVEAKAQDLKNVLNEAWQAGPAWAAGIAAQARSICDQFTEPFVPTLTSAIDLMQARVVNKLQLSANDDWASLGRTADGWSGQFADEFHIFYANYNDVMSRFGLFCSWVNLGFALGAKIIAATQLGAGKFATSLKKNLESQLDHWADNGGDKPSDPSEWPAWVGDVAGLIESTLAVASDIPIVGEVTEVIGMVESVETVMADVDKLAGGGLLPEKQTYEAVMTAEAANELLMTTLHDGHYQAYRDGMQKLNTGGEGSNPLERSMSGRGLLEMMRETKQLGDWGLPAVPPDSLA